MQALIFRKISKNSSDQLLWNLDGQTNKQLDKELNKAGNVIVTQRSYYSHLESFLQNIDNENCNFKKDSIELYRALKLNRKKDRDKFRRIIIKSPSLRSFRSSLNQFIKRYNTEDPPCLLFIPDEIFSEMVREYGEVPVFDKDSDPIQSLIRSVANEKTVKKLKGEFLGDSPEAQLARAMIFQASKSKSPVLILGESGTGKDIIASQIFYNSKYNNKELFIINCSNIPETLVETELFGHTKGVFTDAKDDREGLFGAADGGTLFLDEVGDLSLQNQVKILRAIESNEYKPLGENKSRKVDVRIIAATNRNLAAMIQKGTSREDLYYRLNTLIIFAAPLREHPEDIPIIANEIWSKLNRKSNNCFKSGEGYY